MSKKEMRRKIDVSLSLSLYVFRFASRLYYLAHIRGAFARKWSRARSPAYSSVFFVFICPTPAYFARSTTRKTDTFPVEVYQYTRSQSNANRPWQPFERNSPDVSTHSNPSFSLFKWLVAHEFIFASPVDRRNSDRHCGLSARTLRFVIFTCATHRLIFIRGDSLVW